MESVIHRHPVYSAMSDETRRTICQNSSFPCDTCKPVLYGIQHVRIINPYNGHEVLVMRIA